MLSACGLSFAEETSGSGMEHDSGGQKWLELRGDVRGGRLMKGYMGASSYNRLRHERIEAEPPQAQCYKYGRPSTG